MTTTRMRDYFDFKEAIATAPKLANGGWVKLPASGHVMTALREAGLLEQLGMNGSGITEWPYWGIDLEPDEDGKDWVLCRLVQGEDR